MARARLGVLAVVVGVFAAPSVASAATATFVGPGTDWFAPGNWSTNLVPTSADDVVIDSGTVSISGNAASARSLQFDTGASQTATITVASGASLTISSSGTSAIGGLLDVQGTVTLGDPTTFAGSAHSNGMNVSGTLAVASTFTLDGSDSANGNINSTGSGSLIHVVSGGSLVRDTTTGIQSVGPKVDDDGSISVKTGTLNLAAGDAGSSIGDVAVSDGATLLVGGSTFEAPAVSGAGTLKLSGVTATVGSTDAFTIGNVQLAGNSTFTVDKDLSLANLAGLGPSGGTRNGTGTLTITGSADLSYLTLASGGTTTVAATVASVALTHYIAVDGTLSLDTPTTFAGSPDSNGINVSGTLNIGSTFAFDGNNSLNGNVNATGVNALIHVLSGGSLVRDTDTGTQTVGPAVSNNGSISVQTGTLGLSNGLSQASGTTGVVASAHLTGAVTLTGGTLTGAGDLSGPVTNTSGTVSPGSSPGVLTIDGDYTQAAGGTLRADIAGTTAGSGYDRLAVGGNAALDGTLAIVTAPAFDPALGSAFAVLTAAGTLTGKFSALSGAAVNGKTYTPSYNPHDVTLGVGLAPPQNTAAPAIPSSAVTGTAISCDPGSWTGSPTFAFTWLRDGTAIAGAAAQQYTLADADSGHTITCHVVATNAVGSAAADSNPLVPAAPSPASTAGPSIPAPPVGKQAPPTPVAITQIAALPSTHVCVSRRHFRIHLKDVSGIVQAKIQLTGLPARSVRGKALGLPIDLRGLPKGTVVVRITISRKSGQRLVGKRTYHTCVPGKKKKH